MNDSKQDIVKVQAITLSAHFYGSLNTKIEEWFILHQDVEIINIARYGSEQDAYYCHIIYKKLPQPDKDMYNIKID